jgi:hypothetical protein
VTDTDQERDMNARVERLARERTPGPWTSVDQWAEHVAHLDADGDFISIAKRTHMGTRADIILMAAAPDLLAACERALGYLEGLPEGQWTLDAQELRRALEDAVSRATGA